MNYSDRFGPPLTVTSFMVSCVFPKTRSDFFMVFATRLTKLQLFPFIPLYVLLLAKRKTQGRLALGFLETHKYEPRLHERTQNKIPAIKANLFVWHTMVVYVVAYTLLLL